MALEEVFQVQHHSGVWQSGLLLPLYWTKCSVLILSSPSVVSRRFFLCKYSSGVDGILAGCLCFRRGLPSTLTFAKLVCLGCSTTKSFFLPFPVTVLFSCRPWTALIFACLCLCCLPSPRCRITCRIRQSLRFTSCYLCTKSACVRLFKYCREASHRRRK